MPLICVQGTHRREYFDTALVLRVEEPVDVGAGLKSAGWVDEYAAIVYVGAGGSTVGIPIRWSEWPAVKAALGLDAAVNVTADGVIPAPGVPCPPHDKCFAGFVLMSNPPKSPWVCRRCGARGTDSAPARNNVGEEYARLIAAPGVSP